MARAPQNLPRQASRRPYVLWENRPSRGLPGGENATIRSRAGLWPSSWSNRQGEQDLSRYWFTG